MIVFDEISNMGGKDPAQKEALFKKFYSIFEEGKWRSPSTEVEYDLSKYTFINTGNDMEKLFQGVSEDDIRLLTWEENKNGEKIRSALRKSGVPEAFLNRMADIILMKPLLTKEVEAITLKILDTKLKSFSQEEKTSQDSFKINIANKEEFVKNLTEKFFSQSRGARSIRDLIEFKIISVLSKLVVKFGGGNQMKGLDVELSLTDNMPERNYVKISDPEREVMLRAKAGDLEAKVDVTEYATKINIQSKSMLIGTSYHEAGHAVVNNPKLTGQKTRLISVIGRDGYLGVVASQEIKGGNTNLNHDAVVAKIAMLFGGAMAERLAGIQPNAGQMSDIEKARKIARIYVLEAGVSENMDAVRTDKEGGVMLSGQKQRAFEDHVNQLFELGKAQAIETLTENWNLVRAVAGELFREGKIRAERFDEIRKIVNNNKENLPLWETSLTGKLKKVSKKVSSCREVF